MRAVGAGRGRDDEGGIATASGERRRGAAQEHGLGLSAASDEVGDEFALAGDDATAGGKVGQAICARIGLGEQVAGPATARKREREEISARA